MEVREGFIVGIFNYCDRWCERCPLTSRCLVFADVAALEFEHAHGPLTEPHAARERRKLEAERGRVGATVESFAHTGREVEDAPSGQFPVDLELMIGPDPEVITRGPELRAHLSALACSDDETVRLAIETIEHFAIFVPMKMFRALSQLAGGPGRSAIGRQRFRQGGTIGLRADGGGLADADRCASRHAAGCGAVSAGDCPPAA